LLALIFIVVLIAYVAFRIWQMFHVPSEYSTFEKLLYAPCYAVARLLWRVRLHDGKKLADLPIKGAVVVANHRCSLDPFFVQLAAGRRVHWLVAAEYFKHPLFGKLLRLFQAIPTTRSGSDNSATKLAVRLVSEGRLVGMFPEGRLNRTTSPLISVRPGAIFVANKANAPIVSMWIHGAPLGGEVWSAALMPAAVKVKIGTATASNELPINESRPDQNRWLTKQLLDARL
jgi:1-acyl-sn-glycerol-3-phosphate acyltransferase